MSDYSKFLIFSLLLNNAFHYTESTRAIIGALFVQCTLHQALYLENHLEMISPQLIHLSVQSELTK